MVSKVSNKAIALGLVLTAAVAPMGVSAVAAMDDQDASAAPAEAQPDPVATLVASLQAALAGLSPDASQADIEAAISYALDQSGQSLNTQMLALTQLGQTPNAGSAAGKAIATLLQNKARLAGGTGAVGDSDLFGGGVQGGLQASVDGFDSNYG